MAKVVTKKVRLSYVTIFEPKPGLDGGDPKYSVVALIPKSDTVTVKALQAGIIKAREDFCAKNGANALPARPVHPLHDGDGDKPNGGEYGPECNGHYVLNLSSKQKPIIVDRNGQPILDASEVYSGCYGRVSLNFYGYSNVKKGIGAGLLAVQKLAEGEPFGTVGSADDFADGFQDDDEDDFLA